MRRFASESDPCLLNSRVTQKGKDKKEKRRKEKKEKKHKRERNAPAVAHAAPKWGAYGTIRESDMHEKQEEFLAWLTVIIQ